MNPRRNFLSAKTFRRLRERFFFFAVRSVWLSVIFYKFRPSAATPTIVLFDVRREVPYFYDIFGLIFLVRVATCVVSGFGP